MIYSHLKNAIIASIIAFCILLVISAVQYTLFDGVNAVIYKLLTVALVFAIIFAFHMWATAYPTATGMQKLMLQALNIETVFSLILSTILIMNWFDFTKTVVILSAFQLIHGIIYLGNMFLYDEKPVQKRTLSDQEILEKSNKSSIDPSIQE
ncbi:MAG: hypothetical protein HOM11_13645 [Methylococcales bacterium]|jgi:hypothetical protein|nr:hypothetical protein [Methylococcales bacterium]MBT7442634.1 hypothetical protein [Methylococcales bacterium]